jgi:hypothetical protein
VQEKARGELIKAGLSFSKPSDYRTREPFQFHSRLGAFLALISCKTTITWRNPHVLKPALTGQEITSKVKFLLALH